jgi:hypothetical protein
MTTEMPMMRGKMLGGIWRRKNYMMMQNKGGGETTQQSKSSWERE